MLGFLLFFIIIGLGLYGLQEYYKTQLGIVPQKISKGTVEAFANIIEDTNTPEGRALELGSGYGGFVLGLARRLPGWDIVGVEQSPTPWIIANMRSIGKRFTNYRLQLSDPTVWPLNGYDIIFLNHEERVLKQWETSIGRRLRPGTLLVTLNNKFPRVSPVNTITIDKQTTFYIYQKRPAQQAPAPQPTPEQSAVAAAEAAAAVQNAPPTSQTAGQNPEPTPPQQEAAQSQEQPPHPADGPSSPAPGGPGGPAPTI